MNKIECAVIMAAGFGSRMHEITKDIPKPLLDINGKVIIENMIEKLISADIPEIYVVVGYKKYMFQYLAEKYPNVKLVENKDYEYRNNISSVYAVKDIIQNKNCIICESDILIYDYDFSNTVENSYYLSTMIGSMLINDWGFILEDNRMVTIQKSDKNQFNMIGISYWTQNDINVILDKLDKVYHIAGNEQLFWDEIVNMCLNEINVSVKVLPDGATREIDTFKELCAIDEKYITKVNPKGSSLPEDRRSKLKHLIHSNRIVKAMEAHDGLSALIIEETEIEQDGKKLEFDAIWSSSLCDSTIRAKEDIEIVDFSSRLTTISEIMEETSKPIIYDGDTGGLVEHFTEHVRKLEQIGVSAVIIEDKKGLKRNSLFGTDVTQEQEDKDIFAEKIKKGKEALLTKDFMIIARIESFILNKDINDALERADTYVKAGADGIMIHSKSTYADEILEFCKKFRKLYTDIPLVVVPTTYNYITEDELHDVGVNVVIYANQLIRASYKAMSDVAKTILINKRSLETNDQCITVKEILNLIRKGDE